MKILFFLFFSLMAFSQNEKTSNSDSIISSIGKNTISESDFEKYESKIKSIYLENKTTAEIYITTLLKTAEKQKNNALMARSHYLLGEHFYKDKKDDLANLHFKVCDSILEKNKIIDQYLVKSKMYQSQISKFTYTDEGLKIAKDYLDEMLKLSRQIQDSNLVALSNVYLGHWHATSADIEDEELNLSKANAYYQKAFDYYNQENQVKDVSKVLWSMSSIDMRKGQFDKAENKLLNRIKIVKRANDSIELANAYTTIGGLNYRYTKNFEKAIKYYDSAMAIYKKTNFENADYKLKILNGIALSNAELKNYKEAFSFLDQAYLLKDSIDRNLSRQATIELETKYQSEKKEHEIELLTAQNEASEKQKYIYIAIACLLLISGLFLFLGYRNKIKTAQKLNELNELKSRFFANISHEFRTPLTLIKSPVQQLQTSASDKEQIKQLNLIDSNANRMLELVDQLLELSKIDSGKLQIILKKEKLSGFLNSLVEPFEFKAQQNKIDFKAIIKSDQEHHYFDKDIITKIVSNLIDNAFKYSDENKPIHFKAVTNNSFLDFTISNYNHNLSSSEIKNLFERFYQKSNSANGFGIGLALVKDLVQLYEGTIQTFYEDGKITFKVSLPLHTHLKHAVVIESKEEIEKPQLEETIPTSDDLPLLLIVDDNSSIREILTDIFKDHYKIIEAKDGKKALALAQKEIPDCIISDVMMPELDGFELSKKLKNNELTSFIPIILLTAKTSDEAHLQALQSTADAFLTKPFNHEVVKATVFQQIQERKKLQERYSQELILKPVGIVINSVDEKFIAKLETIVDAAISNPDFTTEHFAEQMNMSRMQLHRKLKSLFGISATEFIRNERLKTAADLLKNKKLSISEIAYTVGFNDLGYFSKCFKEMYHLSPSDYQKK